MGVLFCMFNKNPRTWNPKTTYSCAGYANEFFDNDDENCPATTLVLPLQFQWAFPVDRAHIVWAISATQLPAKSCGHGQSFIFKKLLLGSPNTFKSLIELTDYFNCPYSVPFYLSSYIEWMIDYHSSIIYPILYTAPARLWLYLLN